MKTVKQYLTKAMILYAIKGFVATGLLMFTVVGISYAVSFGASLLLLIQGYSFADAFDMILDSRFFSGTFIASAMALIFYAWLSTKGIFGTKEESNGGD